MKRLSCLLAGVLSLLPGSAVALDKEHLAAADDPGVVAEAVLKAATDARPKLRYLATAGAGRLRLARRFAPASVVDSAVRKSLRIDSVPATLGPGPALGK